MNIKCIAIDDEPLALRQIESYINKTPFLECVALFENAFEALDFLDTENIQLMFVDINMPDLNGLDFVKSLKKRPELIFTTAYSEYAINGFQVDAIDYLLKPISYSDFLKSANKAKNWLELNSKQTTTVTTPEDEDLFVKSDYKIVRIRINDIVYIESANEYIKINIVGNEVVTTLVRLKAIEEQLPSEKFMRVHRSFIVNLSKIKAVEKSRVFIAPDIYIPVGELYKEKFQQYIDIYFHNTGL